MQNLLKACSFPSHEQWDDEDSWDRYVEELIALAADDRAARAAFEEAVMRVLRPAVMTCGWLADQGRRHRARQQDRHNGLGHDGQGRALQGTRRACGMNEIALGHPALM